MIEKAFILEQGNGKLEEEDKLVATALEKRGIPFQLYTEKRIRRRQLPITPSALVTGDVPCVYCAEVVGWKSEFRVYVVNSEIRSIAHYSGDAKISIDKAVVEEAIIKLDSANESVAGYSIDWGILSTGETALVEMNDGFALGAYDIGSDDYADLIIARWEELTESSGKVQTD